MTKPGSFYFGFVLLCVNGNTNPVLKRSGFVTNPEPSLSVWLHCLASRVGKVNQILRCDWLPKRKRWSYLAHLGMPIVSRKKNFSKSHVINPFLTKSVW